LWKLSLDRLLAGGFAAELEDALEAAIAHREYPLGSGGRPLMPKLANLLRRLAECGFSRHHGPQLAGLLAAASQEEIENENTVLVDGMEAHMAARHALMALLQAAGSRLQDFAVAAGLPRPDGEPYLCNLDAFEVMRELGLGELLGRDVDSEAEEAVGKDILANERGPLRSEHLASHPILSPEALNDLLNRELRPEDYDLLLQLDEGIEKRPGSVADASRVQALSEHRVGSEEVGMQCVVCFEAYAHGDTIKRLPCSHIFHAECLTMWLVHSKNSCPLCATKAV